MEKVIAKYMKDIFELVDQIESSAKKIGNDDLLIAYRGESKDFGKTRLMPSLFRNPDYIEKEKHLFELVCDYGISSQNRSNVDIAIDAQHYVAISRMLDISFNALIALYFACCDDNSKEESDGYLYVFGFPESYSPHSQYIEDFYSNILNPEESISYLRNFKVFTHSYSNDRIKAQSGGFIFFSGNEFYPIHNIYYQSIKIEYGDKKNILKELDALFHINKAWLFPEKDSIGKIVNEKFQKSLFFLRELSISEQINASISRIEYETEMLATQVEQIAVLRYLRKEKIDLISYVKKQKMNDNDKDKLIKMIEKKIKSLKYLV